jgi:hypothetical protein
MKPELLLDMPENIKAAVVGTNGSTNTHTITENITGEEQSNESNAEASPAATEQTEAVEVEVVKPQKAANGELLLLRESFFRSIISRFFRCRR